MPENPLMKLLLFAKKREDEYVSLEHLFYGIFTTNNKISKILKDQGVSKDNLVKAIDELRQGEKVTSKSAEDNYQALEKYSRNLNDLAEKGKLDPVIGRDEEIRRILQILSRRTKTIRC